MVSITIPCYNHAHFLADAIRSALAQDVEREVIVIDDGSTDATPEVAASFPEVRYVRQRNGGLAAARNAGLRESRGSHLVFLDADDRLLPGALRAGLAALDRAPDAAFVFGDYRNIDADGEQLGPAPAASLGNDPYLALLETNVIANPATVMYQRWALSRIGGFDTRLRAAEDYDVYLKIARRHRIVHHPIVVAEYRWHAVSDNLPLMLHATLRVLHAQYRWVEGDRRREAAWRRGLATWRERYGRPLVWRLGRHLEQGDWRRAIGDSAALLRHAPSLVMRGTLRTLARRTGLRPAPQRREDVA